MTEIPDDLTTAASIVAMRLMAENLTAWHENVGRVVHTQLALGYPEVSDEGARLIQDAILKAANWSPAGEISSAAANGMKFTACRYVKFVRSVETETV